MGLVVFTPSTFWVLGGRGSGRLVWPTGPAEAHAGAVSTPDSPYALSLTEFERSVTVPRSQRSEVVGGAGEATEVSGGGSGPMGGTDGDGD